MVWFVPFILMWPLFLVHQQVSMKTSTDGLHKLKEFGNHQSRAKVSNWWAESGTQRCSFKILSELPAFKNWEISHVLKTQTLSFFWNIGRSGNIEPAFLLGNTRRQSRVAAVSSDGRRALKFAVAPATLLPPRSQGQGSVAVICVFYSFFRPAWLLEACKLSTSGLDEVEAPDGEPSFQSISF